MQNYDKECQHFNYFIVKYAIIIKYNFTLSILFKFYWQKKYEPYFWETYSISLFKSHGFKLLRVASWKQISHGRVDGWVESFLCHCSVIHWQVEAHIIATIRGLAAIIVNEHVKMHYRWSVSSSEIHWRLRLHYWECPGRRCMYTGHYISSQVTN